MYKNLFKGFVFLIILISSSFINAQVYLREKIERILGETRRIRFSDKLAEDRYLHCRVNQCLNQHLVNINQRRRQVAQAGNVVNKKVKRVRQSPNVVNPRKKYLNQNIHQIYTI